MPGLDQIIVDTEPKRILLADDHEIVRDGVRAILESRADLEVIAEAEDGKRAIELISQQQPDVAIVDYSLPLINGLEVTRQVKAHGSNVDIIIFTLHDSDRLADECFHCGARAVVLKSEPQQLIAAAIKAAAAHKPLASGFAVGRRLEKRPNQTAECRVLSLTPRERTIVQLICEEHSNKEMSRVLGLSVKTIETHRASVMQKLSTKSTAGLVRYALKNLFLPP